jgi:hypothetical protein
MQINFTPQKIKAAKAYLKTLSKEEEDLERKSSNQKRKKLSFFQKLFRFFGTGDN